MQYMEIMSAIADALRKDIPSLRDVQIFEGDLSGTIGRLPVRPPAAYISHEGSEYEAVDEVTTAEGALISVMIASRPQGPGGPEADDLCSKVMGLLSGNTLGLEIRPLAPLRTSLVKSSDALVIHAMRFRASWCSELTHADQGSGAVIRTAHVNMLETSSVSLLQGAEDPAFPLYRLYDRSISRPFRTSEAGTVEVLVDQGSDGPLLPANTLIIPAGHNLEGMALDLLMSEDGQSYSPAVPQWSQSGGIIAKEWASVSKRYWKFRVTSASAVPSIPEIFLTSSYEWDRMPAWPLGPMEDEHNVIAADTQDGRRRFLRAGPPRRRRKYSVPHSPEGMKDEMLLLWDTWGEGRPFWLSDHDGSWIYGGLEEGLELSETSAGAYSFGFHFLEVLS